MVCVYIHSPLPKLLGLSEDVKNVQMEVPVDPGSTLLNLFRYLAVKYPAFESFWAQRPNDKVLYIIVCVDNRIIPEAEYSQILLEDGVEVRLLPPYAGG